ncbi:cupin domain-containing protein [Sphingobacterium haloxyli]|uniref:Cupin domain-containing protein n=1 Tax=Sphingobacterium haloxyli TaxID=2100533 RepID=A0A2S9J3L0_9SPHI|nr:cupin domain-containing protein [Sphingobacterium haloxyli]PRD47378.1 cupin domain-containing protein [Sphingobacterium haloxyli]
MIRSENFQFEKQEQWEDLGNGIKRQVYGYDDTIMLVKVQFKAGAVGELHSHIHAQVTYVESGSFKMTIDDEEKIISKGDGYYVPPHSVHGCVCIEPGMLIDVFSPLREDFLPKT